jgi:2-polyprenyl-3-methyl-5-hydroxy-6-metoxy-1,4-benzoquinol methylase
MKLACRHCESSLTRQFLDLGYAPPSNAYLQPDALSRPEVTYPLRLMVCDTCFLVQTQDYTDAESLFDNDYAYFSSTSRSWLEHAADYAQTITHRLGLDKNSFVVEVASNDGYLLRNFVEAGIPCLGIEPTDSTTRAAEELGIEVLRDFFGEPLADALAKSDRKADLIIGNNVYAHVPDINDFTRGLAKLLKPEGVVTLEFPHLMRLVEFCQFDTVYHEHFSYLSLGTVIRIFKAAGLMIFDVEELPTHGGSLRVFGCHAEDTLEQSEAVKDQFMSFLLDAKSAGRKVAGYGAAAKGNTLLNYAGVRPDLLPFVCDAAQSKQGRFLPGSHIPVLAPAVLETLDLDYIVIFPWNIAAEIRKQLGTLASSSTRFVTAVPELRIE